MHRLPCNLLLYLACTFPAVGLGQTADAADYVMAPEAEVALLRSAAPDKISARATVKVLTPSGYKVAAEGDNGFTCIVMRGWSIPFVRKPEYYSIRAAAPEHEGEYNARSSCLPFRPCIHTRFFRTLVETAFLPR